MIKSFLVFSTTFVHYIVISFPITPLSERDSLFDSVVVIERTDAAEIEFSIPGGGCFLEFHDTGCVQTPYKM